MSTQNNSAQTLDHSAQTLDHSAQTLDHCAEGGCSMPKGANSVTPLPDDSLC